MQAFTPERIATLGQCARTLADAATAVRDKIAQALAACGHGVSGAWIPIQHSPEFRQPLVDAWADFERKRNDASVPALFPIPALPPGFDFDEVWDPCERVEAHVRRLADTVKQLIHQCNALIRRLLDFDNAMTRGEWQEECNSLSAKINLLRFDLECLASVSALPETPPVVQEQQADAVAGVEDPGTSADSMPADTRAGKPAEQAVRADTQPDKPTEESVRADTKADNSEKKSVPRLPSNLHVQGLIRCLRKELPKGRSRRDVAREYVTNLKLAAREEDRNIKISSPKSLLRQARRFQYLYEPNPP